MSQGPARRACVLLRVPAGGIPVNDTMNEERSDSAQWNWVELALGLVMGVLAIGLAYLGGR